MLKLQTFLPSGWVRITSQNKTYLKKKNKKTNVSSKKEFLQQINMGVPNVNFFKCLSGWPLLAIQKFTFQGYNETYIYISISISIYIYIYIYIYLSSYSIYMSFLYNITPILQD